MRQPVRQLRRVGIANRGEVAVRIIHACREMGIESVLLHSEPDVRSRAYRMADHRVCIGPADSSRSYLSIEANLKGAVAGRVDAIHPGFGFLSENSAFARALQREGIGFIGPSAEAIEKLGDKVSCKKIAAELRIPLVPGYEGSDQRLEVLVKEAGRIGFPVIVKAAAGGGGRGMKILRTESEAAALIESAQREALSGFGSSVVFLEKYLDQAKHIEFQVFGDCTGRVHVLLDRECSVQRRHQKIIEEALSPSLTPDLREKMKEAARAIAERAGYISAGTVEFLLQDSKFYFLEVNTRLQVEHPVTEMVMGVDLVKAQLLTYMERPVFLGRNPLSPIGHAIECRVYAENPYLGGVPSVGKILGVRWPEGPGRRFESGFEAGDEVSSHYDAMIAKVVVWDEDRQRCIDKMQKVLSDCVVFGVQTNLPLLQAMLAHSDFVSGKMTTQFVSQFFSEPLVESSVSAAEKNLVEYLKKSTATIHGERDRNVSPFLANRRSL